MPDRRLDAKWARTLGCGCSTNDNIRTLHPTSQYVPRFTNLRTPASRSCWSSRLKVMSGVAPTEPVSLTICFSSDSISACRVKVLSPVLATCRRTASSTASDQSLRATERTSKDHRFGNDRLAARITTASVLRCPLASWTPTRSVAMLQKSEHMAANTLQMIMFLLE
jgi:hypothetical protein